MRKFKVVFHVGTEKTGTTALQRALFNNKGRLLDEGGCYLHGEAIINSRDVAAVCIGDSAKDDYLSSIGVESKAQRRDFKDHVTASIKEKVESLPDSVNTLMVSSEHFHSRLRENFMIESLKHIFEPYASSFQVICYLRRQVDMVVSLYSTQLKGGGSKTLEDVARRMLKPESHYCNYDLFLSKWEKVFGHDSMKVKIFSKDELNGGDIISDFLSETGFSSESFEVSESKENESLTHLGQVVLRNINSYDFEEAESSGKGKRNKKRMRNMIAMAFPGKGKQLSRHEAGRFQSLFSASNEAVRARFFSERKVLFENEFPEDVKNEITGRQEKTISHVLSYVSSGGERLSELSGYDDYVDALKEASRLLEKRNPNTSLRLLELASEIRPDGPAIKNRLDGLYSRIGEK